MSDLHTALKALNDAAYLAFNAAKAADIPPGHMQIIKETIWASDKLVDAHAPGMLPPISNVAATHGEATCTSGGVPPHTPPRPAAGDGTARAKFRNHAEEIANAVAEARTEKEQR